MKENVWAISLGDQLAEELGLLVVEVGEGVERGGAVHVGPERSNNKLSGSGRIDRQRCGGVGRREGRNGATGRGAATGAVGLGGGVALAHTAGQAKEEILAFGTEGLFEGGASEGSFKGSSSSGISSTSSRESSDTTITTK